MPPPLPTFILDWHEHAHDRTPGASDGYVTSPTPGVSSPGRGESGQRGMLAELQAKLGRLRGLVNAQLSEFAAGAEREPLPSCHKS